MIIESEKGGADWDLVSFFRHHNTVAATTRATTQQISPVAGAYGETLQSTEGHWITGVCLSKLTSHFDESSQYCPQHDFVSLDNLMPLVLAHGRVRSMVFWLGIHCTPEKHIILMWINVQRQEQVLQSNSNKHKLNTVFLLSDRVITVKSAQI